MKFFSSFISMNADIRFGKPCIIGTRIAISDILQWLASGMKEEEILKDYPLLQKEIEIWNYAKENNCIIVTNDEDFLNLSGMIGFPPKIVLLKTGNQSNYFLEEIILKHKSDIEALAVSDDYGLIEIF